jgi:transposase
VVPTGIAGRMFTVPAPHPKEFRDDVVAVARRGQAPISQIANTSGSASRACATGYVLPVA